MKSAPVKGLRVLIVEDDADARIVLKNALEDIGIGEVYEAGDGKAGFEYLSSGKDAVDAVLCDWNMPQMGGRDLLSAMRQSGIDVPFLIVTGRSDERTVKDAMDHGAAGFIAKPFSPTAIRARLASALAHKARG